MPRERPAARRATISAWAVGSEVRDDLVVAAGDDLAVWERDDSADGDLAGELGRAGFGDGGVEEVEVVVMVMVLRMGLGADLWLSFGAEEAGDLASEGFDGGRAREDGSVVELEGLAPDALRSAGRCCEG